MCQVYANLSVHQPCVNHINGSLLIAFMPCENFRATTLNENFIYGKKSRIKINVVFFLKIQPRERSLLRLVKIRMKQSARRTARKKITPDNDDDDDDGRRQSPLATCLVYVFLFHVIML